MAEPRFLEFLLKLSDMLRVGEPKLSAVRAMVAAALLREVDAGDGPSDSADSADDAPGVPEEGVTGVSGARKGASGKGVTGVSGAQARARGEDQDRDGPPLSTEELFRQIGDAIDKRGLKFYAIHDVLVKAADKHPRTRLVTDRLLLGYESLEYEEQMAVQAWWRKEDRVLPPSEREGRLRSRSSPRSGLGTDPKLLLPLAAVPVELGTAVPGEESLKSTMKSVKSVKWRGPRPPSLSTPCLRTTWYDSGTRWRPAWS